MVVADEVDIVSSGGFDLILSPEVLLSILQTLQSCQAGIPLLQYPDAGVRVRDCRLFVLRVVETKARDPELLGLWVHHVVVLPGLQVLEQQS